MDLSKGTEYKVIQFAYSSALNPALFFQMLRGGLPKSNGIFFLLFSISMPISFQDDLDKTKGIELFKVSSLKNLLLHNLNICSATFSKNKCMISTGKDLGNSIESNSKRILFPFIPIKKINNLIIN